MIRAEAQSPMPVDRKPRSDTPHALKVLNLVIRAKTNRGGNIIARVPGWRQAFNAFALSYGDRVNIN
jgi:hypothetical protein